MICVHFVKLFLTEMCSKTVDLLVKLIYPLVSIIMVVVQRDW